MRMRSGVLLAWLAVTVAGCGGGGPYGYDREYSATSDEEDYLDRATPVTYEDVRRKPGAYRSTLVEWFGVVDEMVPFGDGKYRLVLTHRSLRPRNLCADETSGSCRVTVQEKEGGKFVVIAKLRPEDEAPGDQRLWMGSLMRVYGHPRAELDPAPEDEKAMGDRPIIDAKWYRHWPVGTYVTTGAANNMRR